jgi:hypothetical protein
MIFRINGPFSSRRGWSSFAPKSQDFNNFKHRQFRRTRQSCVYIWLTHVLVVVEAKIQLFCGKAVAEPNANDKLSKVLM